jgi:Flp pilus assembly pilin Flp
MRFLALTARRLRRRQRDLLADQNGVTAIEFGLLGLPFFAIIAAIVQTSVIFLASQVLESAVQDVSREIRTGAVQQTAMTIDQFRTRVCDKLFGLFPDCDLHIRVVSNTRFQSLSVVVPVDPDCLAPCPWSEPQVFTPGGGGDVVLVQAFFRYPVVIPLGIVGMANLGDGRRLLGSATVFKNEPFGTGGTS